MKKIIKKNGCHFKNIGQSHVMIWKPILGAQMYKCIKYETYKSGVRLAVLSMTT